MTTITRHIKQKNEKYSLRFTSLKSVIHLEKKNLIYIN